jgi:hypothetical protein
LEPYVRKASLPLEAVALVGVALLAGLPASAADPPPDLRISHAAARVVVIPEARQDVLVQVRPGRAKLGALKVRRQGRTQVVEGDVVLSAGWRPAWLGGDACDKTQLKYKGQTIRAADLPVVTVRTPQYVNIESDGFVIGEVGPTQRLTLTSSGCGAWRAGATNGDVRITNKGAAEIVSAGGRGAVTVTLEGPGPITINGGWAAVLWASSKGAGDFTYRGEAGRVDAQLNGKGDITLGKVFGALDARAPGDGKFTYKRR